MNYSIERTISHYEVKPSPIDDGKIVIKVNLGDDESAIQLTLPVADAGWLSDEIKEAIVRARRSTAP